MAKQSRWNRRRDSGLWLPTLDLFGSRRRECKPLEPREFFIPGCAPCCAPLDCEILNDTFTRSDSSSLGADWSEVSGDWEIASNALKITTTSNAICNAVATGDDSSIRITVNVQASATGAAARLIFNYTDANNYWFAEWISGTGTLKLWTRSGGTDTQQATVNVTTSTATNYVWTACLRESDHLFYSTIHGVSVVAKPVAAPSSGTCGVGTGTLSSGNIQFADFLAENVNTNCETCSAATCAQCANGAWPDEITATVSGVTDGTCSECAATYNGTFVLDASGGATCTLSPFTSSKIGFCLAAAGFTNGPCLWSYNITGDVDFCFSTTQCPHVVGGVAKCDFTGHWVYFALLSVVQEGTPNNAEQTWLHFSYDAGTAKPDCADFDVTCVYDWDSSSGTCVGSSATVQLTGQI